LNCTQGSVKISTRETQAASNGISIAFGGVFKFSRRVIPADVILICPKSNTSIQLKVSKDHIQAACPEAGGSTAEQAVDLTRTNTSRFNDVNITKMNIIKLDFRRLPLPAKEALR